MSRSRVVGAVEVGTSKVAVLVGEIVDDDALNIIGHSHCSSKGVKKGVITDLRAAGDCVHAALLAAEKHAGTRIDEVYLAQTGRHLDGAFNVGTATVGSSDGVIRGADMERAKEDAKRRALPSDRIYLHHIQNPFLINGSVVEDPLHREAGQLQVGYWSVHGDSETVSNSLRVIRGIDLEVSDMIVSSIASGAVLLDEAEKENGALVIDMGGGTTDFVLYRKGYIVRTGVVPVGGDHITNDLSIGLRVGRKSAEEFKLAHGRAVHRPEDREEKVWLFGDYTIGDRQYPLGAITRIIDERIDETFGIVREMLEEAGVFDRSAIASGVVLTGGSARLAGMEEAAERAFGLTARTADGPANVNEDLRRPEYSTALGLLHFALLGQEDAREERKTGGLLRRVVDLLTFE